MIRKGRGFLVDAWKVWSETSTKPCRKSCMYHCVVAYQEFHRSQGSAPIHLKNRFNQLLTVTQGLTNVTSNDHANSLSGCQQVIHHNKATTQRSNSILTKEKAKMPPTVAAAQGGNHARETNHDGNASTWNSSYKHIWDQTMAPINLKFDQVGVEDIQNDKAMMLLLTFVN
jgi:hypothetical protein